MSSMTVRKDKSSVFSKVKIKRREEGQGSTEWYGQRERGGVEAGIRDLKGVQNVTDREGGLVAEDSNNYFDVTQQLKKPQQIRKLSKPQHGAIRILEKNSLGQSKPRRTLELSRES